MIIVHTPSISVSFCVSQANSTAVLFSLVKSIRLDILANFGAARLTQMSDFHCYLVSLVQQR